MLTAIFCSLLAAGCNSGQNGEEQRELPVMAVSPTDSVAITEKYSATIEGRQDVEIYPQISGKLTRICVKEGDEVKAGQLLFVID